MANPSVSPEAFLDAVQRHLTPVMETHGFAFCGGGVGKKSGGRALVRARASRGPGLGPSRFLLPRWWDRRRTTVVSAGFERGDGVDEERWVTYVPAQNYLDLDALHADASGPVCGPWDVEHRLERAASHVTLHGLGR